MRLIDTLGMNDLGRSTVKSLTVGLTHYWLLNEQSGNRAASVGGVEMVDTNSVGYADTTPWSGNAAQFDNLNDRILTATPATYTLNLPGAGAKRTFCWWFKSPDVTGSGKHMAGQFGGSPEQSWAVSIESTGYPRLTTVYATSRTVDFTALGAIDNNSWHMCTLLFDGTALTGSMYIDLENPVTTAAGTGAGDAAYPMTLGGIAAYYTTLAFSGAIGLFGVWDRELTLAERTALYNSGNALPYPF